MERSQLGKLPSLNPVFDARKNVIDVNRLLQLMQLNNGDFEGLKDDIAKELTLNDKKEYVNKDDAETILSLELLKLAPDMKNTTEYEQMRNTLNEIKTILDVSHENILPRLKLLVKKDKRTRKALPKGRVEISNDRVLTVSLVLLLGFFY